MKCLEHIANETNQIKLRREIYYFLKDDLILPENNRAEFLKFFDHNIALYNEYEHYCLIILFIIYI